MPGLSISKNDYFSYAVNDAGKTTRDMEQKWSFTHPKFRGQIQIFLQGEVGKHGFSRRFTSFAKKHMLTFGGDSKAGSVTQKMQRLSDKRHFDPADAASKKPDIAKYSPTPANNGSTFILCDELSLEDLQWNFAEAIYWGSRDHAPLQLPGRAVRFCYDGSSTPQKIRYARDNDWVEIDLGIERKGSNKFMVYHCGSARKVR